MKVLIRIISLVVFVMYACCFSTVYAGLMPTKIDVIKAEPSCLSLYAGGVTGPGTGVTVMNDCIHAITINRVSSGSVSFLKTAEEGVMTYLVDVSGKYREVNVAKKNEFMCSYATLPEVKSSKQMGVCGTAKSPPCTPDHFDIPKVPQCRAVTLYPKESALIFIKNYFSFQGDDGVLVDGKSYEITE